MSTHLGLPRSAPESTPVGSAPFDCCPRCLDERINIELGDDGVSFRCLGCAVRWRYELGYLRALA